jgi:hypothetical protein
VIGGSNVAHGLVHSRFTIRDHRLLPVRQTIPVHIARYGK